MMEPFISSDTAGLRNLSDLHFIAPIAAAAHPLIDAPLAVLFDQGCTSQFWINVLLTILLWIPGVIHALWVLLCRPGEHRYHEYQRGV